MRRGHVSLTTFPQVGITIPGICGPTPSHWPPSPTHAPYPPPTPLPPPSHINPASHPPIHLPHAPGAAPAPPLPSPHGRILGRAQVPELLPDVATEALKRVGIEVAASGDLGAEAEAAAEAAASASADSRSDPGAGAAEAAAAAGAARPVALHPQQLPDLWEEERRAWALLLDGTAFGDHMEPLYLSSLKACLAAAVDITQQGEQGERAG